MRASFTIFYSFLCLVAASGCAHRFSGTFGFRNTSTNEIVVDVSQPIGPVGVLVPGARATLSLNPVELPPEVTVSWSQSPDHSRGSHTNILLSVLPKHLGEGHIWFEFTPEHVWKLSYEDK